MKFRLEQIRPNPFRHIERYPIRKEKVDALRESIQTTGFWENILGRAVNGGVEQAFGHHRKEALIAEYGPKHEVEIQVRDFSDEQMLQMMARENMEEWGTSAAVEMETVRAVVEAYAAGQIDLPKPEGRAGVRYAPSFVTGEHKQVGADDAHPYTITSVAGFLGWLDPSGKPQDKVGYALGALELIEQGVLSEKDFAGLSTKDAEAVVRQTRQARAADEAAATVARREAEEAAQRAEAAAERERVAREASDRAAATEAARERKQAERQQASREQQVTKHRERGATRATTAGRAVSQAIQSGEGYRRAPEIAARAVPREAGPPPQIGQFTRRVANDLGRVLNEDEDPRFDRLAELVKHREYIPAHERDNLVTTLRNLGARVEDFADQLQGVKSPGKQKAITTGGS